MTTFWTQLKETAGARLEGEHCHLTPATDERDSDTDTVVSPLPQYGFIRVKGPDANIFLQGQTTADFRRVTTHSAQPGAYCTPKGRMVSSFVAACPVEHEVLLRMRRDIVVSSQAVLAKYAVFSKAELTDASDQFIVLGLAGEQAPRLIEQIFGEKPAAHWASVTDGRALAVQTGQNEHTFELWLPESDAFAHWQALSAQATAVSSSTWNDMNIDSGIADVCAATADELIPQMLNFDATGVVNFKKGCYTGQEVVARLHYRGTAKRRLYRARVASGKTVEGDEVFAGDKTQSVGVIATAAPSGKVLVVLARDALESGDLRTASGAALTEVLPPPYTVKE